MSTSPGLLRSRRPASRAALVARGAIVAAAIGVVAASTSAVADLAQPPANPAPPPFTETSVPPVSRDRTVTEPATPPPSEDPCVLSPQMCSAAGEDPPRIPATPAGGVASCADGGQNNPAGTLTAVGGTTASGHDKVVRFRVEVEHGLAIDPECFADAITAILTDQRGWNQTKSFERVDDESFDFRLILASPDTTNALCYPAATSGKYSCRNQEKVVINLMRWESGAEDFGDDINTYRRYLVNHEVGHFLGKAHASCLGPGQPAPVMMQQTKGVGECLPNGWPTTDESS